MTPLLEYSPVHFRNRKSRISLRLLTMASSQRTTATLLIATLKRIGTLRALLPGTVSRSLADEKLPMANTKNVSGWGRL